MIRVLPFKAPDLADILEGGGEFFCASALLHTPGYGEILEASGKAWSAFDEEERIVGCAGLAQDHPQCVTGWTLLSPQLSGQHMLAITRECRRQFAACEARRIQAHVDPNFAPAVRWVELLGFQYEGLLRRFSPDGRDMAMYSRVR